MIVNFKHKGLEKFFNTGHAAGVHTIHINKLRAVLARLESIETPEDMNLPGLQFHRLKGDRHDSYAISVNKNWRITFKFKNNEVMDVDYEDYH
jgi:proteic killer suppression protein